MFRDREEALQRLQEQLLQEEEELRPEEEEYPDEDAFDQLLEEDDRTADSGAYRNYSNDYGRGLRNYATGYKAYNADKADTDLDRYSDAVREGPKRNRAAWLVILLLILIGLAVGAILWKYLGLEGLL